MRTPQDQAPRNDLPRDTPPPLPGGAPPPLRAKVQVSPVRENPPPFRPEKAGFTDEPPPIPIFPSPSGHRPTILARKGLLMGAGILLVVLVAILVLREGGGGRLWGSGALINLRSAASLTRPKSPSDAVTVFLRLANEGNYPEARKMIVSATLAGLDKGQKDQQELGWEGQESGGGVKDYCDQCTGHCTVASVEIVGKDTKGDQSLVRVNISHQDGSLDKDVTFLLIRENGFWRIRYRVDGRIPAPGSPGKAVLDLRTVGVLEACQGYDVYRASSPDGPFEKVNAEMIPDDAPTYLSPRRFEDQPLPVGVTFYYRIERIASDGSRSSRTEECFVTEPADPGSEVTRVPGGPRKTAAPGGVLAARVETSLGSFGVRLFADLAPNTVRSFVELAEGTKEWLDPATAQRVKKPFYDGRKIFRIVKGFMFQTGAATDDNWYQPGFTIPDEFSPLTFSKPGMLAMANTGRPNSAGCQFFVTTGPQWHDGDGKYTIFGEVVDGMETVMKIDNVRTVLNPAGTDSQPSLPVEMPVIKKVTIERGK